MENSQSSRPALSETHFVAPLDETPLQATDVVAEDSKPSNLYIDAWNDARRRPMFWISGFFILLVIIVGVFPNLFTQVDPRSCSLAFSNDGPSAGHILGYTKQGCDVFARIIYGTSTSLTVGLLATVIITVIGVIFGALGGYFGGWVDAILSRIGDIFFAIPYFLAAVVIMSVFVSNRNVLIIALAIGFFAWPGTARILPRPDPLGQECRLRDISDGSWCVSNENSVAPRAAQLDRSGHRHHDYWTRRGHRGRSYAVVPWSRVAIICDVVG